MTSFWVKGKRLDAVVADADPYEAMQKLPSTDTPYPEPAPKIVRPLLFSRFLFAEHANDKDDEPWIIYSLHRIAHEPDSNCFLFRVKTQGQAEALMKALDYHEAKRIGEENAPVAAFANISNA